MKSIEEARTEYPTISDFILSLDDCGKMVILPYESFVKKLESHDPEDQKKILDVFNNCRMKVAHECPGWKEIYFGSFIDRKLKKIWYEKYEYNKKIAFETVESIIDISDTTAEKINKLLKLKDDLISSNGNTIVPRIDIALLYLNSKLKILKELKDIENENGADAGGEISVDYSDNKILERIIFLYELGILEFLEKKMRSELHNFSANKLSEILSSFMGVGQTTLQSYLNPIYSKDSDQSNNPLKSQKLEIVKAKLLSMGFKNV